MKHNEWQKKRYHSDPEFRQYHLSDCKKWRKNNPDYIKAYKERQQVLKPKTPKTLHPCEVARQNGEKYYFPNKPCKRGHLTLRRVSDGYCVECDLKTRRERYANKNS